MALATLAMLVSCSSAGSASPGALPSRSSDGSATQSCSPPQIRRGIALFVRAWNREQSRDLSALLTADAQLDMSTKQQQALRSAQGEGHESSEGVNEILRFAAAQWALGERFGYRGVRVFSDGGYANRFRASFADHSHQRMTEAKFGFDCTTGRIFHVVISSAEVAHP